MMEDHLADGEEHSLRRKIHRRIRGLLNNVEGFKMDPHGMSGIGEAAVRESVRHQKIAEFIVHAGRRNRQNRQQCRTQSQGRHADDQNRDAPPLSKPRHRPLAVKKPSRTKPWPSESQ